MKLFEPEYSENNHTYTEPGSRRHLPSVTQICEVAYKVRPEFSRQAAARGSKRHLEVAKAISAHLNGQPTAGDGCGAAALRLLSAMDAEPVYVEQAMYSPAMSYAGRIDLVAKINSKLVIIDWKGNSHNPVYNLQIAGYALMAEEVLNTPVRQGIIVNWSSGKKAWRPLLQEGNPEHHIPAEHTDAFKACLSMWHWRQRWLRQNS